MNDWMPMVIVPNVTVGEPIMMKNIGLLGASHPIVQSTFKDLPRLKTLLSRFSDEFGRRVEPALIMVRHDAPMSVRSTAAVSGFRDAVSFSITARARAEATIGHAGYRRPFWAEAFSIYPWMLDNRGESLTTYNSSLGSTHDLDPFRGQCAPGFSRSTINQYDVDWPIFEKLSERWDLRFSQGDTDHKNQAIFRSLGVAYNASMMPGGQEATFYETGRLISLWISAMEILTHTGPGGEGSHKSFVMDLLDSVPWTEKRLRQRPKKFSKRTMASQLYARIYNLRNDFMHGNEVGPDELATENSTQYLHVATSLYRLALGCKVDNTPPTLSDDDANDTAKFVETMSAYSDWSRTHRPHEQVILQAMGLPIERPIENQSA